MGFSLLHEILEISLLITSLDVHNKSVLFGQYIIEGLYVFMGLYSECVGMTAQPG